MHLIERVEAGDKQAGVVIDAMSYNISKAILCSIRDCQEIFWNKTELKKKNLPLRGKVAEKQSAMDFGR